MIQICNPKILFFFFPGCHIQEIPENGADVAHLNVVHTAIHPIMRKLSEMVSLKHYWEATWKISERSKCFTDMVVDEHILLMGKNLGFIQQKAIISQVGPGIVILEMNGMIGKSIMVQTVTPIDPFHQKVETCWYAAPGILNFRFLNKIMLLAYSEHVERDILIWNQKRYLFKPVISKDDGPITKFRRWYSQFYTENSPTLEMVEQQQRESSTGFDW